MKDIYGLDSNVLLRYIVDETDNPEQTEKATHFLEKNCSEETPGYINIIVLVEIVWVLRTAYKYPREKIVALLHRILYNRDLKIEQYKSVLAALEQYETGSADFADYLIGQLNKDQGCQTTVTFDTQAGEGGNFELL